MKMIHFNSVRVEESVTLIVAKGLKTVEFVSSVCTRLSDNTILIEAVKHCGEPYLLNGDGLVFTLIVHREPLPIRFCGVSVDLVKYHGKVYHRVECKSLGAEVNRRGFFRVYVGLNGIVQIGDNNKPLAAIIRDVSLNGFSIVVREDRSVAQSKSVRMVYEDGNKTIVLLGKMVRKEKLEDGRFVYGCKLVREPTNLGRYLNSKQMDRMKGFRE